MIKSFILQSILVVAAATLISGCASTEQGVVTENGQSVPGEQTMQEGRITPVASGSTAGAALGW